MLDRFLCDPELGSICLVHDLPEIIFGLIWVPIMN